MPKVRNNSTIDQVITCGKKGGEVTYETLHPGEERNISINMDDDSNKMKVQYGALHMGGDEPAPQASPRK
jgi:hypothetical protein